MTEIKMCAECDENINTEFGRSYVSLFVCKEHEAVYYHQLCFDKMAYGESDDR